MGKKADTHIVIPNKEIYQQFKELVFLKHGKLKGALAKELENALKMWIEANSIFFEKDVEIWKRKDVKEKIKRFWEYIAENYVPRPYALAPGVLEKIMKISIGIRDPRTIKKYFHIMIAENYLEPRYKKGRGGRPYLEDYKLNWDVIYEKTGVRGVSEEEWKKMKEKQQVQQAEKVSENVSGDRGDRGEAPG